MDRIKIHRFTLVPKPDRAIVWGKIEITVRQSDLQPLLQRYFDEDGKQTRELRMSEHRELGGRLNVVGGSLRCPDGVICTPEQHRGHAHGLCVN